MAGNDNSDANEPERTESKQPSTKPSIVGIGASAGGVQALQTFFEALPDRTGVAFVVIVHLAPESHSELPRILATRTCMLVTQVNEPAPLESDHVYVIPPDRHLRISDNEISAHEFDTPRGHRAPIDLFFRSLAEQHGDDFAIILTGAGSDGAVGLKAVKEAGGIILVQDPNEAEYASMPRSAIATGLADFVLPLREIAARVVELARNREHVPLKQLRDADEEYVRRILAHVCSRTGHDFSQYKKSTVLRRIARRTQVTRREQLADYFAFLRDNVEEVQTLFGDLLISVTTFFRDPKAFEALAKDVIPRLFEGKEASESIRVWVPGCATGEEAYTIAMLLLEEAARHDIRPQVQVFGSDLDAGGLAVAREGRYPVAIEADVSEERLRRFFAREGDHYRAERELRDAILFASHSLLKDPPFSRLDLISCRNLLIYLDRELQQQVCGIFHYALNLNGFLFLGSSESAESPPGLFRTVDREARIYQSAGRSGDKQLPLPKLLGTPRVTQHAPGVPRAVTHPTAAGETALHRLALEREAPPSILVDETHRAVHLSENAGRFLQPSGGPLTSEVTELVRQELRSDLRAALHQAFERGESTLSLPILVSLDGVPHRVYLQVKPVRQEAGAPARQALVLFIEGGPVEQMLAESAQVPDEKLATSETVRRLREELQQTQAQLRATREDAEATNEELRAGNEELQSINEEYRSTSEELETSKEELQSLNEELQTVNNELKLKFEWVSRAHSDLQNLMASTDVGTLFLDTTLRIKLFTPYVANLFNITSGDEDRSITDFTHQLDYDGLADDARAVLEKLAPVDREIRSLAQSWYLMRLRPYRTVDNKIDGVVVTFVEVTERRNAEEALRQSEERYRTLVEAQPDPICQFLPDTTLTFVNRAYAEFYGREPEELTGRRWLDFAARGDRPRFLDELATFTPEHPERHEETQSTRADRELRWYLCHVYGFFDNAGNILSFQTFGTDITARKGAEEQLAEQLGLLTAITASAADAIFVSDGEDRVTLMNPAAERIFGWSGQELTGRKLHDAVHDRHPDGRPYPASECPLSRVYATGETLLGHEDVFFHKDGSKVPVACSRAPLVIEGRIAGSVLVAHDITERKQSEAALRESEARYRTAGEAIRYGVWVCNPEGGVEFVSRTFLDLIGKTLDEVKPRGWLDRLPPEDLKPTLGAWHACVRTGSEWAWEHRVKGKDGVYRTILSLGRPVRDDQDRITSWVGFNLDISERKKADDALRESEIRMRALLDASQDEILLVSVDGEVLAINKAAERRLAKRMGGSTPVNAHLDRLLPRDQAESRLAIVREVAATATLAHWEVQIRARWFEFWFYPVLHADRPVSEVAVYAREITEQKKSQADRSKLFQAIQQSPTSVIITNRDGTIEYVNPKFTDVTGYARAEAIGQNPRILKSGHTPSEQYAELWNTISSGRVWRGEFLNKKKNGELFWELAWIAPVNDGEKITNFVAVKEDITERKEIEDQLRQSQKMQAVGQLTGGIAHDFNNLLTIVMGNLQLLEGRVSGDAKAREYLDDALWSARRGGELTHRLLAFARKQPLKPAVIDLNEVVRGMTDLLRRTLGASIRIEESLAPDLWKALADRGELERALVNLAVNARDAMRSAGTLTVETHNAVLDEDYAEQYEEVTPGEYVLLAVTDTGTGMPPEIVQRAFEPFFTTKEVGQGSGLGLSMVYGFAKQTGGHVSIHSRVGHGTCVKLYLPRAPFSPAGREEDSSDVFPEDLGNKIVLVVEDEAKLLKLAVKMLDRLGLQSFQAETAKDALELLADTHVDVLFTDIELPGGMNGTELAEAAHQLYPEIKVLFTTGYARETTLHERGLHERAPWLLKPYSHQELARELKALLAPVAGASPTGRLPASPRT